MRLGGELKDPPSQMNEETGLAVISDSRKDLMVVEGDRE